MVVLFVKKPLEKPLQIRMAAFSTTNLDDCNLHGGDLGHGALVKCYAAARYSPASTLFSLRWLGCWRCIAVAVGVLASLHRSRQDAQFQASFRWCGQ